MLIGTLFGKMIEDAHGGHERVEGDAARDALQLHFASLRANERALLDDEALDLVYRMFDLYRSRDGGVYRGQAEYEFYVYLPECGPNMGPVPIPIKGYMDLRVETEPLIIEAKTSKWMDHPQWGWTQHRVNTSPQAAIYWYVDHVKHQRDSEVRYLLLGYRDNNVSMRELSTHPDMDRVIALRDEGAKLWQAIKDEQFECRCGKCKTEAA
jgi:hypothetical protein